jgi:hypothetical protein
VIIILKKIDFVVKVLINEIGEITTPVVVEEMILDPWDPPVSERAKKRAPDSCGLLVSPKRQVRQPWKDPPRSNPAALSPRPRMVEPDKEGQACRKGTTQVDSRSTPD